MPKHSVAKESSKIPFWRDVRVRSWALQALLLAIVGLFFFYLYSNFKTRTASSPVPLGFDFLYGRAGFPIEGSSFDNDSVLWKAFIVGFLNTVRLVIPGLILTTIVGILIGIARLSKNVVLRSAASGYVEAVRNIPLLVFVIVVYFGFVQTVFPRFNSATDDTVPTTWDFWGDNVIDSRRSLDPWFAGTGSTLFIVLMIAVLAWIAVFYWGGDILGDQGFLQARLWGVAAFVTVMLVGWFGFGYSINFSEVIPESGEGNVIVSRRGLDIPWFVGSKSTLLFIFAAAVLAWFVVARWRRSVFARTGAAARTGLWGVAAFAVVFFAGWLLFGYGITTPEVIPDENNGAVTKATGGINMSGGYFAMLVALVMYTSSHVAEIIRGSIQAVHKGQDEAAAALALSAFQRMWHVVLPQALRTAIPPLGNQYLNLMKNSSLAGIVAYFDLTKVAGTAVGGSSPAIPAFLVTMSIYLFFSLTIALLINIYNRRMALVTR